MDKENIKTRAYLGGLWVPGPSGVTKGGAKKKEKGKDKKQRERKKERKRKEKKGKRKRGKKEKIKVSQHDERGAMQFRRKLGLKGRKLQGRQIDGEKR